MTNSTDNNTLTPNSVLSSAAYVLFIVACCIYLFKKVFKCFCHVKRKKSHGVVTGSLDIKAGIREDSPSSSASSSPERPDYNLDPPTPPSQTGSESDQLLP